MPERWGSEEEMKLLMQSHSIHIHHNHKRHSTWEIRSGDEGSWAHPLPLGSCAPFCTWLLCMNPSPHPVTSISTLPLPTFFPSCDFCSNAFILPFWFALFTFLQLFFGAVLVLGVLVWSTTDIFHFLVCKLDFLAKKFLLCKRVPICIINREKIVG